LPSRKLGISSFERSVLRKLREGSRKHTIYSLEERRIGLDYVLGQLILNLSFCA
jgi:hypothetical protein